MQHPIVRVRLGEALYPAARALKRGLKAAVARIVEAAVQCLPGGIAEADVERRGRAAQGVDHVFPSGVGQAVGARIGEHIARIHGVQVFDMLVEKPAGVAEPVPLVHALVAAGHIGIIPHDARARGLLPRIRVKAEMPAADGEGPDGCAHSVAEVGFALEEEIGPRGCGVETASGQAVLVGRTLRGRHHKIDGAAPVAPVRPDLAATPEEVPEMVAHIAFVVRVLVVIHEEHIAESAQVVDRLECKTLPYPLGLPGVGPAAVPRFRPHLRARGGDGDAVRQVVREVAPVGRVERMVFPRVMVALDPSREHRVAHQHIFALGIGAEVAHARPVVVHLPVCRVIEGLQVPPVQLVVRQRTGTVPRPGGDPGIDIAVAVLHHAAVLLLARREKRPHMHHADAARVAVVDPLPIVQIRVLRHALRAAVAHQHQCLAPVRDIVAARTRPQAHV